MRSKQWGVVLIGVLSLWLTACDKQPDIQERVRLKQLTDRTDVTFIQVFSYDSGGRVNLIQSYFDKSGPFPPFSLAQANQLAFQYDTQGRLTQTDYLDYQKKQKIGDSRIRYAYDATGKISTATYMSMSSDGVFTDTQQHTYELDAQNRPLKKTEIKLPATAGQVGLVTTYTYNNGNLVTIDAPVFQAADRVETGRFRTTYTYDSQRNPYYGLPATTIWGEQLALRNSQNNMTKQVSQSYDKAGSAVSMPETKSFTTEFDANGRLAKRAESASSTYGVFYEYETY